MTEDVQGRQRKRMRLWLALAVTVAILAVVLVPPLVSISRYKSRITQLMSVSLGRPVRLSSVELRLLPIPGFVLTDLTVEEDPALGAEPVLHASTVTASIRLLSLWRGRLEISRISVDDASLNLLRTASGRWNLDSLFRTAAAKAQPAAAGSGQSRAVPLPYLEATNSRINIKSGAEKLPFSLVNTDLSLWQEDPGDWRIRLRGQPARTDLSLDLADTGLVRLEGSVRRAAELRQIPVHLDVEWREAQLGQLTRLVIGSDPGWRGDLTGELHLDGTADAAQIKIRLRAAGVHRAEFAPAAPLDFDATCGFLYHYSKRTVEKLVCDSPLGDGRIHLAGELPAGGRQQFSVELDRVPVAAGLDALRTVRSDFGPGLEATGAISGKIGYSESATETAAPERVVGRKKQGKVPSAKAHPATQGPLTGSFSVEDFQLSGDGLRTPIQTPRLVLEPMFEAAQGQQQGQSPSPARPPALSPALAATVAIPAGGAVPLTVTVRLALAGYQVTAHGQASVTRARELAHVARMANASVLDELAGDPIGVDLNADGPWLPAQSIPFSANSPTGAAHIAGTGPDGLALTAAEAGVPAADSLSGTVNLRNANWKADYLASHVEIAQATLHLGNGELRWDPVVFSYGPVKGTASLSVAAPCASTQPCVPRFPPRFEVQFGDLDAAALQAAILGAREPGTLLSTLIARLGRSNTPSAPVWPQLEGTVQADSLILGPVTLRQATATLRILESGAEITDLDAGVLGGRVHGSGMLRTAGTDQSKPAYTLEGKFEKLSPVDVGQLLGLRWSGGAFDADGKIELSGFTDKDLAGSVKGRLHFEWREGRVGGPVTEGDVPAALSRFDRWSGDAEIGSGTITLKQNQVRQGSRKRAVEAELTLGDPPKVTFAARKETRAKR
ncbi:MAG TPA: AsmA family protein [Terracidiphilus sp.]